MTVVKILRYIQHVFSFRVQPVRTMTVTTIELLSRLFRHVTLTICFDRFDWSLAIGYLVSTNMASLLWTHQAEKLNTSNVILCPAELSNFWYKLFMLTKIIKWNDMVNLAYYLTQAFHSHEICLWVVKKWTGKIVSNSLFLQEFASCYDRLWEFSVTKPISYKDVFFKSFCSPTFRLTSSLVEKHHYLNVF